MLTCLPELTENFSCILSDVIESSSVSKLYKQNRELHLRSYHRLALLDRDTLRLWLAVLRMDENTPIRTLRLADHWVCSDHFDPDDFCQRKKKTQACFPKEKCCSKSGETCYHQCGGNG